jgi:hypothetical protein
MKKTRSTWLCKLTLCAGVIAPSTGWSESQTPTLALHLYDYTHVPNAQWTLARREAERVYADIGVRLLWVRGKSAPDAAAAPIHVSVVIMSRTLAERIHANALGVSEKPTATVYIYYSRIADTAGHAWVTTGSLLGRIIAHEVGHLLLTDGHSKSGIMRAFLDPSPFGFERFDDTQAETIRQKFDSNHR